MEHHTTTMAVVKKKRKRIQGPAPQWGVVRQMLHMRIKDASTELNVPESYLRRLCKKNGYPIWPGKTIRYMNSTGRKLMPGGSWVGAPEGSPLAGLAAGPSQQGQVTETKKEEKKELVTLNLLDKVGSSSGSN